MNEILIYLGILIIIVLGSGYLIKFKFKPQRNEEDELEKSMEDEFIIDPETGAKITLDEAENGVWETIDNSKPISQSELNNLPEFDRQAQTAINHLKRKDIYTNIETLSDSQIEVIDNTEIINSYDEWSYSEVYEMKNGLIILLTPQMKNLTYYAEDYSETQLMYWIKIQNIKGHYVFRESTQVDKMLNLSSNENLPNYKCYEIQETSNLNLLNDVLTIFEEEKELIIEIKNDNLFIKTLKFISINDVERIEKIVQRFANKNYI